jgi:hypothetical protein
MKFNPVTEGEFSRKSSLEDVETAIEFLRN